MNISKQIVVCVMGAPPLITARTLTRQDLTFPDPGKRWDWTKEVSEGSTGDQHLFCLRTTSGEDPLCNE